MNFHKQNKQCAGSANLQLDVTLSHSVARNLHLPTTAEHGLALAAYLADHCVRRYAKRGKLEKPSRLCTRVWHLRRVRHLRLHLSWAICTRAGRTGVGSCNASAACSLAVLGGRLVQPSAGLGSLSPCRTACQHACSFSRLLGGRQPNLHRQQLQRSSYLMRASAWICEASAQCLKPSTLSSDL